MKNWGIEQIKIVKNRQANYMNIVSHDASDREDLVRVKGATHRQ